MLDEMRSGQDEERRQDRLALNVDSLLSLATGLVAAAALALLTAINCLGVRAGSRLQAMLTLTAIAAIALLEGASFWRGGPSQIAWRPLLDRPASMNLALAFGAAMTPVLFAYGGWQTSSFLGGEVRDAGRREQCGQAQRRAVVRHPHSVPPAGEVVHPLTGWPACRRSTRSLPASATCRAPRSRTTI